MATNNSVLPLVIYRPVLVYYVGSYGDSMRIIYPTKASDYLNLSNDDDLSFCKSLYSTNDVIDSLNAHHEILHWEYV